MNSIPASHLAVGSCLVLLLGGIATDSASTSAPVENWLTSSYPPPAAIPGGQLVPAIEGCALRAAAGVEQRWSSGDLPAAASGAADSPFLVSGRIVRLLPRRAMPETDPLF